MRKMAVLVLLLLGEFLEAEITREEIIQKLALPQRTETMEKTLPLSPPEHEPYLLALEKELMRTPDAELAGLLYRYQVAYPNPDCEIPARIMGRLFLEQHAVMVDAFEALKAGEKIRVMPYLGYGWEKAIEGKNTSIPRIAEKQKRLDRLKGSILNR